uniref:Uncharacterized protein n=1 Tax=viral metagenome TaxID=1070528 RepID=A0A6C0CZS0_9ZZZZ
MDQSNLYTKGKNQVILEDDPPINSQSWVCLSFVSPEDVIKDKDGFIVAKFLQSYAKSKEKDFEKLYDEYMNFKYKNSDAIDRDFNKQVKNITNIRGVKVRGTYSTQDEAKLRAEYLHKMDPSFHVFIGTVGQWLPWDPSGDKIDDEVFLDEGLNTLVSEYKKQSNNRDELFSERMQKVRESKESKESKESNDTLYDQAIQINTDNLESDPWIENKISEEPVSEEQVSEEPLSEEQVSEEPLSEEQVSDKVNSDVPYSGDDVETIE